jgi:hypothetical protein
VIALVAGASLTLIAALDSVVSWPSDRVLLTHTDMSRIAGSVLGPCWPWMLASYLMVFGIERRKRGQGLLQLNAVQRYRWPRPRRRMRVYVGLVAAVCATVIATSFAFGGGKGDGRILPGPRYEISTISLNDNAWTTVSPAEYQHWEALFIREDSLFILFGLMLSMSSAHLLWLRRLAQRIEAAAPAK